MIKNFQDFNASQLLISPRHKLAFEYNSFDTKLDRERSSQIIREIGG